MPSEHALVARIPSHIRRSQAANLISTEAAKGCEPLIIDQAVALEPAFRAICNPRDATDLAAELSWTPEPPAPDDELLRLQVWESPQQCCDWLRAELFLKHLASARRRLAFEVVGNRAGVVMDFLCHQDDEAVLRAAFAGQFEQCELSALRRTPLSSDSPQVWQAAVFRDYYPPPPYSHLLTQPGELRRSPFATLFTSLSALTVPAVGVYQVVFQAVAPDHDWHRNVQVLVDLEYTVKLLNGLGDPRRYPMQTPGADERNMAMDVETKAHNDKPFYAVGLRIGVLNGGRQAEQLLRAVAVVASLIQHGGRPLGALTEHDYRERLSPAAIRNLFGGGVTYRPGLLANSAELASLVHLPPPEITTHIRETPLNQLETLPPDKTLAVGTPVGYCDYAGVRQPVCIPRSIRGKHQHVIGRPGCGKTSVVEGEFLDETRRGAGAAVLDPHGDLSDHLLRLLPKEDIPRVIYFNPGDLEWVPLWNPLQRIPGQDAGRTADDLVGAFKSFVDGWGDRLEHLLRNIFYSALCLPRSTLLDVSNMLRQQNDKELCHTMMQAVDNESARQFWQNDFSRYRKDDFGPPRNKLSKLLLTGTVSLMLSQPDSAFSMHAVMDKGMILLADLSTVGSQVRSTLGCLMLALLHLTALSRSSTPAGKRRRFHIYCDEAHRFMTDALEEVIAETRKFNVSLTLAHQYMTQFGARKTDALSNVGSTIIFNVDSKDAQHLTKDLRGLVKVEDLIALEDYQAIARIGNRVVRFRTYKPPSARKAGHRDAIVRYSHEHYYRRSAAVRAEIRKRGGLAGDLGFALPPETGNDEKPDTF